MTLKIDIFKPTGDKTGPLIGIVQSPNIFLRKLAKVSGNKKSAWFHKNLQKRLATFTEQITCRYSSKHNFPIFIDNCQKWVRWLFLLVKLTFYPHWQSNLGRLLVPALLTWLMIHINSRLVQLMKFYFVRHGKTQWNLEGRFHEQMVTYSWVNPWFGKISDYSKMLNLMPFFKRFKTCQRYLQDHVTQLPSK